LNDLVHTLNTVQQPIDELSDQRRHDLLQVIKGIFPGEDFRQSAGDSFSIDIVQSSNLESTDSNVTGDHSTSGALVIDTNEWDEQKTDDKKSGLNSKVKSPKTSPKNGNEKKSTAKKQISPKQSSSKKTSPKQSTDDWGTSATDEKKSDDWGSTPAESTAQSWDTDSTAASQVSRHVHFRDTQEIKYFGDTTIESTVNTTANSAGDDWGASTEESSKTDQAADEWGASAEESSKPTRADEWGASSEDKGADDWGASTESASNHDDWGADTKQEDDGGAWGTEDNNQDDDWSTQANDSQAPVVEDAPW
jgi:hypothetical protein